MVRKGEFRERRRYIYIYTGIERGKGRRDRKAGIDKGRQETVAGKAGEVCVQKAVQKAEGHAACTCQLLQ